MYYYYSHKILYAFVLKGYCNNAEFIAAQAPLSQTVNDLWQLIWQFKPSTIVTLCNLQEDGKVCVYILLDKIRVSD